MFNSDSPFRRRGAWILFPILFVGFALLVGWVVMWLWNAILPEVVGVKMLNYPQALGLLVLSRILFGGFRAGGGNPYSRKRKAAWREKWMHLSEEERAQMRASWEQRCKSRATD